MNQEVSRYGEIASKFFKCLMLTLWGIFKSGMTLEL